MDLQGKYKEERGRANHRNLGSMIVPLGILLQSQEKSLSDPGKESCLNQVLRQRWSPDSGARVGRACEQRPSQKAA